nr:hypothetical protein [Streptomyces sp. FXJ1.172]WEP00192.1 hypothetical protein A6P39_013625 [Streptomyces sp. FXJ1.172]
MGCPGAVEALRHLFLCDVLCDVLHDPGDDPGGTPPATLSPGGGHCGAVHEQSLGRTPDATPQTAPAEEGEDAGGRLGPNPGTKIAGVSLDGTMWDVYQGDIGWQVYSFVRRANTTGATRNLDDFTQALVRRRLLSNDKYVSGIESGTEVFHGTGGLGTKSYSVDIG